MTTVFDVRHKMTKSDQYYFTDSIFQLELNLHNIRRELILMIEEFEKEDCFSCLQLKCRCVVKSPEKSSNSALEGHDVSGGKIKEDAPNQAPSADSLPKPKFEVEFPTKEGNVDIEAWMQASRVQKAKTDRYVPTDVLLALKKYWTESRNDITKKKYLDDFKNERIILDSRAAANAVELFFNSFKVQPVTTAANLGYVTNVAAIYGDQKSRSSEYTYF